MAFLQNLGTIYKAIKPNSLNKLQSIRFGKNVVSTTRAQGEFVYKINHYSPTSNLGRKGIESISRRLGKVYYGKENPIFIKFKDGAVFEATREKARNFFHALG